MHGAGEIDLGEIPSHGCRLLRVCKVEDGPQLVGDTLHITQGCEIAVLAGDGQNAAGKHDRPGAQGGRVALAEPAGQA